MALPEWPDREIHQNSLLKLAREGPQGLGKKAACGCKLWKF
ncbi:hypothetical protein [Pseudomonas caricapapayae]